MVLGCVEMSQFVYKSVTDGKRTWSIIIKNGKYHFHGESLRRCDCPWIGCEKIQFYYEEVAKLYSMYQFLKYDRQNTVYWSDDCSFYHLRTSRCDDVNWVRR